MTKRTDKPVKPVTKPFLTGEMTDESTPRSALIFFGIFLTLTLCSLLLAWRIPTVLMILVSGMMGYALFSRKGAAK